MHHMQLKAAVSKFTPLLSQELNEEEIRNEIKGDDKGYSAEDIEEIYQALVKLKDEDEDNDITDEKAPAAPATQPAVGYIVCKEVKGRFDDKGKFIEHEVLRENVKLTPQSFETLNAAANPHKPIMYIEK